MFYTRQAPAAPVFTSPGGAVPALCGDMLERPHVLIAGSTGSGKSVLLNSLICSALTYHPNEYRLILIDPKRVELCDYRPLVHTLAYASEPGEIVDALQYAVAVMESRYKGMQSERRKMYDGGKVLVIVDELADLLTTQKRAVLPLLQRLAQLGRAAKVGLYAATQRPTRDILSGQLKVNMDCRVGLHCPSAIDSRNIIEHAGAEALPLFGYGYYITPQGEQVVQIPFTPPEQVDALLRWWIPQGRADY